MTILRFASPLARGLLLLRRTFLAALFTAPLWVAPLWVTPLWVTAANAQPPNTAPRGQFPDVTLPAAANGAAAVAALGAKLPDVAAFYGKSASEFARMLREDLALWLDTRGRVFYIDPPSGAAVSADDDLLDPVTYPLSETFLLNSKPDSQRTIFLDFDGHITTGSAWAGGAEIVSPPYDTDNNYSSFGDGELIAIQRIWRQVAEDFAPFDVNITTEDPGADALLRSDNGDSVYGSRIVFTDNTDGICGGCGGVAYVGVYNRVGDFYQPAWVFNKGVNGAGEAASHEVGHNLGLYHDGTVSGAQYYRGHGSGATGWAPIMGVGYYKELVQWSAGEYFDANETQDDIAFIQAYGIPLKDDDHGDTTATASDALVSLGGGSTLLDDRGVISTPEDVDVFRFYAGTGDYSISVAPVSEAPNLDVLLTLRDASGNVVNSSNPTGALDATISGSLGAGEYYLAVDGVGEGDVLGTGYSDYGSLGNYRLTGSVADGSALQPPVAAIAADYIPGPAPLQVDFNASGSLSADQYGWSFGDGGTDAGELVSYNYFAPGTYTATLTVTSTEGLTDTDSLTITVDNRPPTAVIAAPPADLQAPVSVDFDASGSSDPDSLNAPTHGIVSYSWNFGDGTNGSGQNPTHSYTEGGTFTVTLTVTDSLGATGTASTVLDVAPPPFTEIFANSQLATAGTATGGLSALAAVDGAMQEIREQESGGKPSRRTSLLDYGWFFDLPAGDSATLYLTGYQDASSDGDQMAFFYRLGNNPEQSLPIQLTPQVGSFAVLLPAGSGSMEIIARDSNRDGGNRSLDSLYLDELRVVVSNSGGGTDPETLPAAPSGLEAVVSGTSVSLSWADNADNETGFVVYRAAGGAGAEAIASLGAGSTGFNDTGLTPDSSYGYFVAAFNSVGEAASNTVQVTTGSVSGVTLSVAANKVKGQKEATLTWQGTTSAKVYRDGSLIATVSGSSYTDSLGKGGGTYLYQVCTSDDAYCSDMVSAVF